MDNRQDPSRQSKEVPQKSHTYLVHDALHDQAWEITDYLRKQKHDWFTGKDQYAPQAIRQLIQPQTTLKPQPSSLLEKSHRWNARCNLDTLRHEPLDAGQQYVVKSGREQKKAYASLEALCRDLYKVLNNDSRTKAEKVFLEQLDADFRGGKVQAWIKEQIIEKRAFSKGAPEIVQAIIAQEDAHALHDLLSHNVDIAAIGSTTRNVRRLLELERHIPLDDYDTIHNARSCRYFVLDRKLWNKISKRQYPGISIQDASAFHSRLSLVSKMSWIQKNPHAIALVHKEGELPLHQVLSQIKGTYPHAKITHHTGEDITCFLSGQDATKQVLFVCSPTVLADIKHKPHLNIKKTIVIGNKDSLERSARMFAYDHLAPSDTAGLRSALQYALLEELPFQRGNNLIITAGPSGSFKTTISQGYANNSHYFQHLKRYTDRPLRSIEFPNGEPDTVTLSRQDFNDLLREREKKLSFFTYTIFGNRYAVDLEEAGTSAEGYTLLSMVSPEGLCTIYERIKKKKIEGLCLQNLWLNILSPPPSFTDAVLKRMAKAYHEKSRTSRDDHEKDKLGKIYQDYSTRYRMNRLYQDKTSPLFQMGGFAYHGCEATNIFNVLRKREFKYMPDDTRRALLRDTFR